MSYFKFRKQALTFLTAGLLAAVPYAVHAQSYPNKPITFVVGSTPGGILDTVGRIVAKGLEKMGQPVVVQNLPGAGSSLATAAVASAPADGYTIAMVPTSFAINPSVYTKLPFDTKRDFLPISQSVSLANVLVVNPSLPARTLQEFIELAKKRPGEMTYGSAGNGQSNHLSGENFKAAAGIQMNHIPYKGSSAAMVDLLGGTINAMFVDTLTATPQIKAGKLRALATSGTSRLPALPDLPTFAESGLPNFDASSWLGVVVRKGTPPEVAARITSAATEVMHDPEVRAKLIAMGVQPVGSTSEQFVKFLDIQFDNYANAVKRAGVKLD